jgi:hypothetical protein
MKLEKRWALMIALNLLNINVFSFKDWELYVVAVLIGIGVGDLLSNK